MRLQISALGRRFAISHGSNQLIQCWQSKFWSKVQKCMWDRRISQRSSVDLIGQCHGYRHVTYDNNVPSTHGRSRCRSALAFLVTVKNVAKLGVLVSSVGSLAHCTCWPRAPFQWIDGLSRSFWKATWANWSWNMPCPCSNAPIAEQMSSSLGFACSAPLLKCV